MFKGLTLAGSRDKVMGKQEDNGWLKK